MACSSILRACRSRPLILGSVLSLLAFLALVAVYKSVYLISPGPGAYRLPPLDPTWMLVFQDEFASADCPGGLPNRSRWSYEKGYIRNGELQSYGSDNAACGDGYLTIQARRSIAPDGSVQYTSSSLLTEGLHEFMYGRFEMRGKIDIRMGSWPAWWAMGANWHSVGWPKCGEIDIMEYTAGPGVVKGNIGYASVFPNGGGVFGQWWKMGMERVDAEWASSFHTWVMLWSATEIVLYRDGIHVAGIYVEDAGWHEWGNPFRKPMFMLLNQAVGPPGGPGGDPAHTAFPLELVVDYVRVYQPPVGVSREPMSTESTVLFA